MKFISTQLAFYFSDRSLRQNVGALLRYVAFLLVVVTAYAMLFHFIKLHVEEESYSWVTGFYWTLTVMSTLGFGDITFTSDIGRAFSMVVLLSGIVLLLIVLPFAFIRYFYAPWLEARLQLRAPRRVPAETKDHIILCAYDTIAEGLVERFKKEGLPYFVLEPDASRAVGLRGDEVETLTGEIDSTATYQALNVDRARMVIVNREDTVNTNIVLTIREIAPQVPLVAVAGADASVDVLELSGANKVLPLKRWLGEHLANRVTASHARAHVIGRYHDLLLAELPVRHTPLAKKTIRDTRLREISGMSIIGVWKRGRFLPALPDLLLTDESVPIISGTAEQLDVLDDLLFIYDINPNPVVIIGGGRVGRAAARTLGERETPVVIVERNPELRKRAESVCDRLVEGDAADHEVLMKAGLMEAPSVVLTTNDDAMNIFLASYCRRLNPELRIVSRITHERNLESIHRAGAEFVLSYSTLGVMSILSVLQGNELIMLGEGLDVFTLKLPSSLAGRTLAESGIGASTGLIVIGLQRNERFTGNPPRNTILERGTELVVVGDAQQRRAFSRIYG